MRHTVSEYLKVTALKGKFLVHSKVVVGNKMLEQVLQFSFLGLLKYV